MKTQVWHHAMFLRVMADIQICLFQNWFRKQYLASCVVAFVNFAQMVMVQNYLVVDDFAVFMF